jgi:hypothetical protein
MKIDFNKQYLVAKVEAYVAGQVLSKYGNNPQKILDASTRTNKAINAQGALLAPQFPGSIFNHSSHSSCECN